MFLAVDIGNSAIKFGLFDGDILSSKFSIPTKRDASADEIKLAVGDRLCSPIEAAIVCSVVPEIEAAMREFLNGSAKTESIFVNNSFDFGLKIDYEPLDGLGTDRLVAAFAAVEKYGAPCIVCSFGTATTIDVVSADREFLGGVIAPGLNAMVEALHLKAARLPRVEIERPAHMLGHSTAESIRSGVYHGYAAMVEGLITRMRTEAAISRIVGTGGNLEIVSSELVGLVTVDENLLLDGLRMLKKMTG
ncbi:MAG: type III pantothenate kinase [Acidobacteriota bacterium]